MLLLQLTLDQIIVRIDTTHKMQTFRDICEGVTISSTIRALRGVAVVCGNLFPKRVDLSLDRVDK